MTDLGRGTSFGRYRLQEELGHGGMGVVHRAVIEGPEGFTRVCVVKRLIRSLSTDDSFVKALTTEARLSALLHHPGIVQVLDFGRVDGEVFLALEYVDGRSLHDVLADSSRAERKLPPGLACYIVAEVATALAYAHALRDEQGRALEIVHRDVGPANVMVSWSGAVKLLDFGIAKAADHLRDERSRTGVLKGKLGYMSPEQADGGSLDGRSDLFSLGVLFHELLTGRPLFKTVDDLHTLDRVRAARASPTGIDPEIDGVLLSLLARSREDRPTDGDAVAHTLRPIIHRLHADAAGLRDHLAALREHAPPRTTPGKTRTRAQSGRKRSRAPTLLLGAAVFAALLVAGAWASLRQSGPVPPHTSVQLRVLGTGGAEVRIDGVSAGAIPLELTLPSQQQPRRITANRAGRVPADQTIAGDHDATLRLVLERAEEPSATPELK